jgi:hypothetical protein
MASPPRMTFLTHERVRQLLDYNPETGKFTWRHPRHGARTGKAAGTRTRHGYNQLCIDGKSYRASRVAWLWMTGEWPPHLIDHINRDRADDRWSNLRSATTTENNRNQGLRQNNRTGYRGVCFTEGRYRAMLQYKRNGRCGGIFLGLFDTPQEAAAAYNAKAREVYGEFAPDLLE